MYLNDILNQILRLILNFCSFFCLKHPHPYISAMVNNGTLHYDHDKDGTHTELAGCEAPFRNKDHDTYVAVRYYNYRLSVNLYRFLLLLGIVVVK